MGGGRMGWVRYRRRGGLRLSLRLLFLLGISVCFLFGVQIRDWIKPSFKAEQEAKSEARYREKDGLLQLVSRRHLLSKENVAKGLQNESVANSSDEDCTPAAYHEFPPDVFTSTQRAQGAIVIHCLVLAYMFVALAVVCDDYFVSSLDRICEKLHLSADVAGATFMAAGSSAPELFTSIIGVFVTRGDVGVGTIVGSAVFNILFVVGICALLAGQVVPLSQWPLLRDCTFYSFSVIILIAVISDSFVTWYESVIMLTVYILYIIVMRFNSVIYSWLSNKVGAYLGWREETQTILPREKDLSFHGSYERFNDDVDEPEDPRSPRLYDVIHVDDYVAKSKVKWSFAAFVFRFLIQKRFRTKIRFINAVRLVILQRRALLMDAAFLKRHRFKHLTYASTLSAYSNRALKSSLQTCLTVDEAEEEETSDDWRGLPPKGTEWWQYITWITVYPIRIILYYTIPDCRKKRWERWFMLTFTISIIWIAGFSYMMVWMMTLVGFTLYIPDSIMGITFIAAGTSIPDAMASIIVARQGLGDMAVSNTIGSNVFDVLIGLALPWFIKTGMVHSGSMVHINSNGLVFAVVLLFLTVIVTITAIHLVGWVLNKKLGIICICVYCVFLTFAIMIECNVFGYVNPPTCKE